MFPGPTPNLFKGPIPAHKEVDRPDWVKKEEAKNPKAEFWQYSFSSKETKTGKADPLCSAFQLD